MARFAILAHDHPVPHWDLFLEDGDGLRSWRILHPLSAGDDVPAEALHRHRLLYLDYEGPVSGGRGSVSRIDQGRFDWLQDADGDVRVHLHGSLYQGELRIFGTGPPLQVRFSPSSAN